MPLRSYLRRQPVVLVPSLSGFRHPVLRLIWRRGRSARLPQPHHHPRLTTLLLQQQQQQKQSLRSLGSFLLLLVRLQLAHLLVLLPRTRMDRLLPRNEAEDVLRKSAHRQNNPRHHRHHHRRRRRARPKDRQGALVPYQVPTASGLIARSSRHHRHLPLITTMNQHPQ